jgi:energy-coupling factor transporter ATP-binding protein EcfA2
MFRFRELSLWNWDYWSAVRIPLDREVVLLSGPNGSGKTTLLDAIRQLLHAPRLSSRRRLQHYLRRPDAPSLIRAVVSNEDVGLGQPFRRERITTPDVTLACALLPTSSGAPEKRFAVLPGRASLDDLRARLIEPRGDFFAPERYARVLEQAGVTRSLMSVLALEQGRTNSLFEKTPRALLQDVLDMMGDRAVLERYREARSRYDESEREVARQGQELQRAQIELNRVGREVARLGDWERAADKVSDLERRVPAAQLQQALRRRADAAQKLPELRTKLKNGESERIRLERDRADAEGATGEAEATLEISRREERASTIALEQAARTEGVLASEVTTLEGAASELAQLPMRDLAALIKDEAVAARARMVAEAGAEQAAADEKEARERLAQLEGGRRAHPAAVEATLEALAGRGIPAILLATVVEAKADSAPAVEAALGDARWALGIAPEDEPVVLAIAAEHRFPGPVWSGATVATSEDVGPLRLEPGAPAWLLAWCGSVRLQADGSWIDEHGTWTAREVAPALGERGREAGICAAQERARVAAAALAPAHEALEAAVRTHSQISSALGEERRRRELSSRVATLPPMRVALEAADKELKRARATHEEKKQEVIAATALLMRALAETERAERGIEELDRRIEGERKALRETEEETVRIDAEIAVLTRSIGPDLRLRAERMELDSAETTEGDLRRARKALESMGAKPDPTVREDERHLRANVEEAERHVAARTQEAAAARQELSACRTRYLEVVSGALQDYRRRAIEIARGAQVAVEMDLPRLTDDDRALDDAELHVRFGFDGKDALPLGDSSFSGGQQVIGGLVLLMAMVDGAGRGFFMLDEPFAHLSIDRIDDVGRFLRSSGAQFVITAPTTLDRAQLDPASLVIMLRKKRPVDGHAPVPMVAEA